MLRARSALAFTGLAGLSDLFAGSSITPSSWTVGDFLKANRASRADRAEVGVGTLIVFIAMVLVAAVAAAVLVNTTGSLQQRAQQTGKEATQEVASNLKVVNVYGSRPGTDTDLNTFQVHVELSAGAVPIDLSTVIVRWKDDATTLHYVFGAAQDNSSTPPKFEIACIRGSCGDSDPVMQSGDLVEITFSLEDETYAAERTDIELTLLPEAGAGVSADFRTPSTYGSTLLMTLR